MKAMKLREYEVGDGKEILERIPSFGSILCDVGGRKRQRCVQEKVREEVNKGFWGEKLLLYLANGNDECEFWV